MKRREFLKSLGDAAAWSLPAQLITVASPTATCSQAAEKKRRVGVLFSGLSSDPANRPVLQALVDGLREHGWEEGRNVNLEIRYSGPDPARFAEHTTASPTSLNLKMNA
jgi:putative ABC transport system substrate-binding protein